MSLFCNTGAHSAAKCSCCQSTSKSYCCCVNEPAKTECTVAGTTTEPEPVTIHAMLQTVLDSCCTTADINREFTIPVSPLFNPCELEIGSVIGVELAGDITYKEVEREKEDCKCVSSVRFQIPIRFYNTDSCGCVCNYINKTVTVVRSASLCCTADSIVLAPNTRVLAVSAVVTDVDCDNIHVSVSLLFRSCLQQTIFREYAFQATPVCEYADCNDSRNMLYDKCDLTCGCPPLGKSCPSC